MTQRDLESLTEHITTCEERIEEIRDEIEGLQKEIEREFKKGTRFVLKSSPDDVCIMERIRYNVHTNAFIMDFRKEGSEKLLGDNYGQLNRITILDNQDLTCLDTRPAEASPGHEQE